MEHPIFNSVGCAISILYDNNCKFVPQDYILTGSGPFKWESCIEWGTSKWLKPISYSFFQTFKSVFAKMENRIASLFSQCDYSCCGEARIWKCRWISLHVPLFQSWNKGTLPRSNDLETTDAATNWKCFQPTRKYDCAWCRSQFKDTCTLDLVHP